MQPDSIIPNPANPQNWNRFSYVENRPINFNDPTGHCRSDNHPDDCFSTSRNYSGSDFLDLSGYTTWERKILKKLYDKGGDEGRHGVEYILAYEIHLTVGKAHQCVSPTGSQIGSTMTMTCTGGDWQSLGNIAGWYERDSNTIFLNPSGGYNTTDMPSTWGLATIIHEAYHLEQGAPLTKYKELETAQIGFNVAINLGGYYGGPTGKPGQQPDPLSRDGRTLALTLSHDPAVINEYSEILRQKSFVYWFFYNFLTIDSPRPAP